MELLEVRALLSGGLTGAEPEVYLPGSLDSTPEGAALLGQPGNSDRGALDQPITADQSQNQASATFTPKALHPQDDYPLPPARGPKLQGDLEAQPAAMALLLSLKDSPQILVPTLLTFSGRGIENEAAVALAHLGESTKTGPVADGNALALNAPSNPLDFMLLDVSKRMSPNRREIDATQDDGLLAQPGADSSQGLFPPRHRQSLGQEQGETGARQVTADSAADAVEGNFSGAQRSGYAGSDASAWVASVEIRTSESFKPEEQMADGPGQSVMLPAESISEGAIDTAESGLADPRTAIRTGRFGAAQSMVAILLASSAGLVFRYGRAVERTTRYLMRRSRFIQP